MLTLKKNNNKIRYFQDESDLIKAIAENDESAFEFLYDEYYSIVSGFIKSKGGEEEDARDIFQEAIMSVWQNIKMGRYEDNGQFKSYFVQICKFKWYDQLKSASRNNTIELNEQITSEKAEIVEGQEDEKMEKLLFWYDRIQEPCKGLLRMFYFERKSFADIGKVLNITPESAKNQKYRCVRKIKELIKN
jgi:RNA polymerase sigma factor (sigma-70 family)